MADKTVAELQADIAAAQLEIDRIQAAPLQAVLDAFNKPTIASAIQVAQDSLPMLTGERRQQVENMITVLTLSPAFLAQELDGINVRLNPPEVPTPAAPAQ